MDCLEAGLDVGKHLWQTCGDLAWMLSKTASDVKVTYCRIILRLVCAGCAFFSDFALARYHLAEHLVNTSC
jgi:hypothetical protein